MMKKIQVYTLLLFLSVSMLSHAQTVTRETADFHTVKVFDRITAVLLPGTETKVVLEGTRAEEVQVMNQNGELRLRLPMTKLLQGDDIHAVVYYKSLEGVEASEGSQVEIREKLQTPRFKTAVKEGARITAEIEAATVEIRATTGGELRLKGTADYSSITVGTGGIVDTRHLQSKQIKVSVNAGGEVDAFASELAEVRVRAGGTVHVYGNPPKWDEKVTLGGSIRRM